MIHHVTNHVISYLFKHAEHPPLSRPLVVDKLTFFYNSKSSHNGSASLFGRQGRSALFFVVSALRSALRSTLRFPLCPLPVVEDLPWGVLHKALRLQTLYPLLSPLLHQIMTFSKSSCGLVSKGSGTRLQRLQRPQQPQLQRTETILIGLLSPIIPIYTIAIRIWSAATSVSNARTISRLRDRSATNVYLLLQDSWRNVSLIGGSNTRLVCSAIDLLPWPETSLRPFWGKA